VTALEAAVARCRFRCVECGTDEVVLKHAPVIGHIPVIRHWPLGAGTWCPVLDGGEAAQRCSLDLLSALAVVMGVGDYGEPVLHELAGAA
jgi:hypothetical protein